jgi:hypothetical protein
MYALMFSDEQQQYRNQALRLLVLFALVMMKQAPVGGFQLLN